MNKPSVALLGPPMEHREVLEAQLSSLVAHIQWIPDSRTFLDHREWSRVTRIVRSTDALWGTRDRSYLEMVLRSFDTSQTDMVIAFWGTIPLPDLQAIKKARPHIKTVLLALSYPVGITPGSVLRQRINMLISRRSLDGIICPTKEMVDYLHRDFGGSHVKLTAIRPGWPASFFSEVQAAPVSLHPNVVFVGRTDFSGRTALKSDDVRPLLSALLDAGIEVHHAASKDFNEQHDLRHAFAPVPLIELIHMMSGFDAALMAANLSACKCTDRYDLAVPDRLISSVASGVPIVLPRHGYAAAKTYMADYPYIEFDTPKELHDILSDRRRLLEYRNAAWAARRRYTAEAQSEQLSAFLTALLQ